MITVVFWIIFGGLAGWIGALIDENHNLSQTLGYICLGIVGALTVGSIMQLFGGLNTFSTNISSLLFPTIGTIIILFITIQTRRLS